MTNHMPCEEPVYSSDDIHIASTWVAQASAHPRSSHRPSRTGRVSRAVSGTATARTASQNPAGPSRERWNRCPLLAGRGSARLLPPGRGLPRTSSHSMQRGETRIRFASCCPHSENARCKKDQGGDEAGPEAQAQLRGTNSVEGVQHVEGDDGAHARRSDDTSQPLDPPSGRQSETSQRQDDQAETQQVRRLDVVIVASADPILLRQHDAQQHERARDEGGNAAELPQCS